jgi:hypothetical protein
MAFVPANSFETVMIAAQQSFSPHRTRAHGLMVRATPSTDAIAVARGAMLEMS